nr:hypothetical protein [Solirubrobacterales bacterium]
MSAPTLQPLLPHRRWMSLSPAVLVLVLAVAFAACGGDDQPARVAAEPSAGSWRTWVLDDADAIEVAPPPA